MKTKQVITTVIIERQIDPQTVDRGFEPVGLEDVVPGNILRFGTERYLVSEKPKFVDGAYELLTIALQEQGARETNIQFVASASAGNEVAPEDLEDAAPAKKKTYGVHAANERKAKHNQRIEAEVQQLGEYLGAELRKGGAAVIFMEAGRAAVYTSTSDHHSKTKLHAPQLKVALGRERRDILNEIRAELNKQYEVYRGVLLHEDLHYTVAINNLGVYYDPDGHATYGAYYQATAIHASEHVQIKEFPDLPSK